MTRNYTTQFRESCTWLLDLTCDVQPKDRRRTAKWIVVRPSVRSLNISKSCISRMFVRDSVRQPFTCV